jgi:hypothetical protein
MCAIALLALVVSPLTAPFAAGHPLDLLGGASAHVQSKKAPDEPVVTLAVGPALHTTATVVAEDAAPPVSSQAVLPHSHSLPLRL